MVKRSCERVRLFSIAGVGRGKRSERFAVVGKTCCGVFFVPFPFVRLLGDTAGMAVWVPLHFGRMHAGLQNYPVALPGVWMTSVMRCKK